jgi:hypothetical protein
LTSWRGPPRQSCGSGRRRRPSRRRDRRRAALSGRPRRQDLAGIHPTTSIDVEHRPLARPVGGGPPVGSPTRRHLVLIREPSIRQARRAPRCVKPIVTAYLLGYSGHIGRFPSAGHYARYNATAPIEASSGPVVWHRLNPSGNRQLNHTIHLIAGTQLRYNTPGRAYYLGTHRRTQPQETMRALKLRISDAVSRQFASTAIAEPAGPEGHWGTTPLASVTGSAP